MSFWVVYSLSNTVADARFLGLCAANLGALCALCDFLRHFGRFPACFEQVDGARPARIGAFGRARTTGRQCCQLAPPATHLADTCQSRLTPQQRRVWQCTRPPLAAQLPLLAPPLYQPAAGPPTISRRHGRAQSQRAVRGGPALKAPAAPAPGARHPPPGGQSECSAKYAVPAVYKFFPLPNFFTLGRLCAEDGRKLSNFTAHPVGLASSSKRNLDYENARPRPPSKLR